MEESTNSAASLSMVVHFLILCDKRLLSLPTMGSDPATFQGNFASHTVVCQKYFQGKSLFFIKTKTFWSRKCKFLPVFVFTIAKPHLHIHIFHAWQHTGNGSVLDCNNNSWTENVRNSTIFTSKTREIINFVATIT